MTSVESFLTDLIESTRRNKDDITLMNLSMLIELMVLEGNVGKVFTGIYNDYIENQNGNEVDYLDLISKF